MQHAQAWSQSASVAPSPAPARKHAGIDAIDFTKGMLVLIMVLYHWLNYFVSTGGEFYRYLRFLTPSFIFITGFVIANVYVVGYGIGDPRVPRRLIQRGFKLLVLFVAINLIKAWLTPGAQGVEMRDDLWSPENIYAIFVTGNVGVDGN